MRHWHPSTHPLGSDPLQQTPFTATGGGGSRGEGGVVYPAPWAAGWVRCWPAPCRAPPSHRIPACWVLSWAVTSALRSGEWSGDAVTRGAVTRWRSDPGRSDPVTQWPGTQWPGDAVTRWRSDPVTQWPGPGCRNGLTGTVISRSCASGTDGWWKSYRLPFGVRGAARTFS